MKPPLFNFILYEIFSKVNLILLKISLQFLRDQTNKKDSPEAVFFTVKI